MKAKEFYQALKSPFKYKLFLLSKLPMALLAGLKVKEINENKCVVSVPYKWMNKNPFRSTYFAALAMAGELSTGALAMATVMDKPAKVAMLVVQLKAEYFKKAVGRTYFTCNDGAAFAATVEKAISENQPQQFTATSVGVNDAGESIATFYITWSFKAKQG